MADECIVRRDGTLANLQQLKINAVNLKNSYNSLWFETTNYTSSCHVVVNGFTPECKAEWNSTTAALLADRDKVVALIAKIDALIVQVVTDSCTERSPNFDPTGIILNSYNQYLSEYDLYIFKYNAWKDVIENLKSTCPCIKTVEEQ